MLEDKDFWDNAAKSDPFGSVRTGWSETDFDTKATECLSTGIKFKPTDIVLDYGCGPGYSCKMVAPKVRWYIGLDYSEEMLAIAQNRNVHFANATFSKCDGVVIPFADAFFDCIFCQLVFQHNARPQTLEVLAEFKRVMKPGARFAIQLPTLFYGADVGFTPVQLGKLYPEWDVSSVDTYYIYLKHRVV